MGFTDTDAADTRRRVKTEKRQKDLMARLFVAVGSSFNTVVKQEIDSKELVGSKEMEVVSINDPFAKIPRV